MLVLVNHVLRGEGSADMHVVVYVYRALGPNLVFIHIDPSPPHTCLSCLFWPAARLQSTTQHNNLQIKQIDKMFGWGEGQDHYDRVYNQDQGDEHEGRFSHELLAGGAAFGAMKLFEDEQRREGKQINHAFAKELIAGIAGGEVDKLCETKGADYIDRERAKHEARRRAEAMYDQHYGQYDEYNPNYQEPPRHLRESFNDRQGW
ncbi:hypothetical protein BTJ68_08810 [Hortaea werneckii EXF-2000]|uniref:CipC-like antibiotic response protein n=2 Tax=Hortaea werneckii TaxID=91943 RepID=A0A3M7J0S8_HORWE|nr:hypothetical protein BTJ68_08810 [Hortaea werneckii EXF-2000]RMZ31320.1 hypothetical protein D0859_04590 [Hortaea werneckii]